MSNDVGIQRSCTVFSAMHVPEVLCNHLQSSCNTSSCCPVPNRGEILSINSKKIRFHNF